MGMKIFVENLPSDISEEKLKNIFGQIGAVESVWIRTDLLTRRSKGSGYVEMALDVDAFRAINCFNGATIKDRRISLKEAAPFFDRARHIFKRQTQGFDFTITRAKKRCNH